MTKPRTFAELEALQAEYARLLADQAELARLTSAGIPHDPGRFVNARYGIDEIEAALLDAGLFKTTTGDVVSWARRKA